MTAIAIAPQKYRHHNGDQPDNCGNRGQQDRPEAKDACVDAALWAPRPRASSNRLLDQDHGVPSDRPQQRQNAENGYETDWLMDEIDAVADLGDGLAGHEPVHDRGDSLRAQAQESRLILVGYGPVSASAGR
jgi:hypothetical protein